MDDEEKKKMLDILSGKGEMCPKCGSRNFNFAYHGEPIPMGGDDNKLIRFKKLVCQDCNHDWHIIEGMKDLIAEYKSKNKETK